MKSARIHHFGGPDQIKLEDTPRPVPGRGQVLVEVIDASVNPIDWKIRANFYKQMNDTDLPLTLGQDIAGRVTEVGQGVTKFKIGDRVFGFADEGAYAEYTLAGENTLALIAPNVDFTVAASLPTACLTAWQAVIDTAHVGPGMKVLIQGAAGGVGSFAAQICKWRGAKVVTTSARDDFEYLKSLGVDELVDYKTERFEDRVRDVDAALDLVGGEVTARTMKVVKKGGIIVSTTHTIKEDEVKKAGIRGVNIMMERDGFELETIMKLVVDGAITPRLGPILPLDQAAMAQEMSEKGKTHGKLVLEVAH